MEALSVNDFRWSGVLLHTPADWISTALFAALAIYWQWTVVLRGSEE
jgi:hypothetical protein